MIIGEGLPFIKNYVQALNNAIKSHSPERCLSKLQCYWLSFLILGVLVTNTLCWSRFERFSIGHYKASAICWMFRKARIAWDMLLTASTLKIVESYGVRNGTLVLDDTDSERSKNTKKIGKVHKIRDKKRSGFFNGQNIVFLLLVTEQVTLPVGFEFYEPDPTISAWKREDKRLRKSGVKKTFRPKRPDRNPNFPDKKTLGLKLLKSFHHNFKDVKVKSVIADAFYGTKDFFEGVSSATGQRQVISQMRKTQLINVNGKYIQAEKFFSNYQGKTEKVTLRHHEKKITFCSAKFKVKSHDKRRYVIALKYEGETDYRYLIASDTTWRDIDIIKAYALRWLVEVFIQDWKSYEGWNQLAMQRGVEGSEHGLIISLLTDHALQLHEDQFDLFKNKKPAATVRSLREKVMMESLKAFIETIVKSDNPKAMFEQYSEKISALFELKTSIKHMRKIDIDGVQNVA